MGVDFGQCGFERRFHVRQLGLALMAERAFLAGPLGTETGVRRVSGEREFRAVAP